MVINAEVFLDSRIIQTDRNSYNIYSNKSMLYWWIQRQVTVKTDYEQYIRLYKCQSGISIRVVTWKKAKC